MLRILLLDGRELSRDVFKVYLERLTDDIRVLEAATPEEAVEIAAGGSSVDLLMLDLDSTETDGLAALELLRERLPDTPRAALSGSVGRSQVLSALEAGATGIIPKTLNGAALLGALQVIRAGERFVPASTIEAARFPGVSPCQRAAGDKGVLNRLTPRQRDVLDLLTHGYSNKEIAEHLRLRPITVATHLKGVYRKLNVSNRTQAVTLAMELAAEG